MGGRLWEGAGPDMSGPYRAAMMLRLRCHEGLRGGAHGPGGINPSPTKVQNTLYYQYILRSTSQHRRQRLGGVLSGAEGLVQRVRVAADLY